VSQVKAKKKMHRMSGMKRAKRMKGTDGMKGGGMKGSYRQILVTAGAGQAAAVVG
jgi:hypothetical protein